MNFKSLIATAIVAVGMLFSPASHAQSSTCTGVTTSTATGIPASGIVSEDFTCQVSSLQWFFFNGACLTAGTSASTTSPGGIPACSTVMNTYYGVANYGGVAGKNADATLVGGQRGYLGSSTSTGTAVTPDDSGFGALRFTNGYPYGNQERGAIVSDYTFPTSKGVQISFKSIAYLGNTGSGGDGADGISFFLLDGCMPIAGGPAPDSSCPKSWIYGTAQTPAITQTFPAIGATGGSLAYSCSNSNLPYDGLVGGYLAMGVDEWGNFLNGSKNTLNEPNTSATSDNTASGGGYQPGRIGMRGAGSISWQALNTAYGTNSGSGKPYYPASLGPSCSSGTLYNNQCGSCSSGATFSSGSCTGGTLSCPTHYGLDGTSCATCLDSSQNPHSSPLTNGNTACNNSNGNTYTFSTMPPPPIQPTYTAATDLRPAAVQATCSTGLLYNYSNPSSPVSVGNADLNNTANTAGIMDYPAIVYSVIPTPTQSTSGFLLANESATTRSAAFPVLFNLKITQDGFLSLSYSYNGGTAVPVIANQNIKTSNGPLPGSLRFGFAGSTGGSTNVHEILCFKAAPVEASSSSGAVNVYQNPFIRSGTQIFIANYFPSDWTGQLEAFPIGTTNGIPSVGTPTWDARCVLSGNDPATNTCDSTLQSTSAQGATNRVMLSWDPVGQVGEPFEWPASGTGTGTGTITPAQQTTLTKGDATQNGTRLAYLRGDTTNELTSSGSGIYRARNSILSDIVDSSPMWVGPPQEPYTLVSSWVDQLYLTAVQPEDATGAQTYADYMSNSSTGSLARENVVYAGANDGFLHGFRAGALDVNGNLDTSNFNNDGHEVLAYMPAVVLNSIHPVDSTNTAIAQLDFSNPQYSHNWYVDSTPAQGDVFYGNKWHTWVVSGLGPGGAAIFALDVTNPSNFSEANAASIVKGEWSTTATTTTTNGTTSTPNGSTTTVSGSTSTTTTTSTATTTTNGTTTTTTTTTVSASSFICPNQTPVACGINLGNTFGAPQIRRFHSGQWGFVFGNGFGSINGASGIYIGLIDNSTSSTGAVTFYWLPTNLTFKASTPNGISYVWAADLDLDNTVDYIYAGDLLGNIWRFDVTSQSPTSWAVSASSPLFNAGQPITTQPIVSTIKTITWVQNAVGLDISNAPQRVVVNFGTGQQIPQTLKSAAIYATGTQSLYGIWDWDMGTAAANGKAGTGWNGLSPNQAGIGLTTSPGKITTTSLVAQTLTETPSTTVNNVTTTGTATLTQKVICWDGTTLCSDGSKGTSNGTAMGWYTVLPSTNEQIIFNPLADPNTGALVFNTYIPAANSVLSCSQAGPTGFSIGMDPGTGAALPLKLFTVGGASYDGVQTNAAGTASVINTGEAGGGKNYLVTHNGNGTITFTQVNNYNVTSGQRVYWIQKR
jgi:type IV pilus assembly protein PilY1